LNKFIKPSGIVFKFIPILVALIFQGQFIGKNRQYFGFKPVPHFLKMTGSIKFKGGPHQEKKDKRDQKMDAE